MFLVSHRFHNGSLLDQRQLNYDSTLVLRNLQMDQAGEYYCRASNEGGSIKSKAATLTVIGVGLTAFHRAGTPEPCGCEPAAFEVIFLVVISQCIRFS